MREKCLAIIAQYIQMLNSGHVKLGVREVSAAEAGELAIPVLEAVAGDIRVIPEDNSAFTKMARAGDYTGLVDAAIKEAK